MNSDDARLLMNHLGSLNKPFVFLVDFEMARPLILEVPETARHGLFFNLNGFSNFTRKAQPPPAPVFRRFPMEYEEYLRAFRVVSGHLHHGDSYLVNLTFPT